MVTVRSHVRAQITWLAFIDLMCLVIGSIVGILVRLGTEEIRPYVYDHIDGWLVLFGGVILANYLAGSYRVQYTFSRFNLVVTWLFSLVFAILILSMTSYTWFIVILGRGVLLISVLVYSVTSLTLKLLVYRAIFRSERFTCRTVVVGSGKRATTCRSIIEREFVLPAHKVVAYIKAFEDEETAPGSSAFKDGIVVIDGAAGNLEEIVKSLGVSLIVLALDDMRKVAALYPHLKRLRFGGIEVLSPLNVAEIYSGTTPLEYVNEEGLMQASMESGLPMVWRTKRLFHILISITAIAVLFPLFGLLALLMKLLEPRSSVIYSQVREGRFGVPFTIYKLRTMREGAEADSGPIWSPVDDPRITRIGKFLRTFRIDEVPQFINVLKGEMSVVGPRPERPAIAEELAEKIPYYRERENVMPGLSGWAQIRYPYGNTVEDATRKLEFDLFYMKHLSLSLDLQIILSTLRIVLFGKERAV